jgi:hypothetical protein
MNRNKLRNLIFAAVLLSTSARSFAGTVVAITVAPPPLPVYAQPVCPGDGYIWTPGYWAYGPTGYTWVAGAWVLAPHPGYLFTPGYWGLVNGAYVFHRGYWGLHVGYYGGVNYGYGYTGFGFHGGRWEGGHFFYNRAFSNVNAARMHNVYREERREHEELRGHDRRREHEARSREHGEHGDKEHAHLTRVASHSGGGHTTEHRGRK